jgi:hypothetical protein
VADAERVLSDRDAEAVEERVAGLELRADDDGAPRDHLTGLQANPAEFVAGDLDAGDLALDKADTAGRELLELLRIRLRRGVQDQG